MSAPGQDWEIRDLGQGDEQALIALHERAFGQSTSAEHWAWEYAANPAGSPTIRIASVGERVIGHFAGSPRNFWFCGDECVGALAHDVMTDPDYARRGVFSALAEAGHAAMAARGYAFTFGFPNASAIDGFEKHMRWKMIMPTPMHVKPLDVGGIVAARLGRPELTPWLSKAASALSRAPTLLGDLDERMRARARGELLQPLPVSEFDRFDELVGVDELWERCRNQHRLWAVRDLAYLRWRYDDRPDSDYLRLAVHDARGELVGFAVLAFAEREQRLTCFIMDLVVDGEVPRAVVALLRMIEERARERECAFINAMVAPGSRHRGAYLKQAYLPLPERLFPQEIYFGVRVLGEDVDSVLVLHPESWELSWGDLDLV